MFGSVEEYMQTCALKKTRCVCETEMPPMANSKDV